MSGTDESPDELRPDRGVTRLNRLPIVITMAVICVVVLLLGYGIIHRTQVQHDRTAQTYSPPPKPADTAQAAAAVTGGAQKAGAIEAKPDAGKPVAPIRPAQTSGLIEGADRISEKVERGVLETPDPEVERRRQLALRRQKLRETSMNSSTGVQTFAAIAESRNARPVSQPSPGAGNSTALPNMGGAKTDPAMNGLLSQGEGDPNQQSDKIAFLDHDRSVGYLHNTREMPLSRYEIKAGTVIPATLVTGINSDLPGLIKAQVTQNVYDSATGNILLIPQGSQLVGMYNSRVSVGQSRVEVVWTRLNFPGDGSTLELGAMPGADISGYGGFNDKVNNHLLKIFGDSLMLSVLSAGAQLSQPQTTSANGTPTTGQTITAAIGQQFAATGTEMTKRNMQIQPTLEIRPGYVFNVIVNKDVILRPYTEGNN